MSCMIDGVLSDLYRGSMSSRLVTSLGDLENGRSLYRATCRRVSS